MKTLFIFLFLIISVFNYSQDGKPYAEVPKSQKLIHAKKGSVVCAHPLAAKVGIEIMKKGGNAFDAAIATQLVLAVVYPEAGNIGGGGFMVARTYKGKLLALDYREKSPLKSQRNMYLDDKGNVIEGKSLNGHLSSGVPGTVAGIFEILKFAKLPFQTLIQPAIDLAENGFALTENEAAALNEIQNDLVIYNTTPSAFVNKKWKTGDLLIQKDLANTLKLIRDKHKQGFYEGVTAEKIVKEMQRGSGIITSRDLTNYKAIWRPAYTFNYKGYTIVSMPMPSSGGVLLHQMFKMVENRLLPSYSFESPEAVQLMTEVERRAYADRAEFMGDADFYNVPVKAITSQAYLENRMIDYQKGLAGNSKIINHGALPANESKQTTHISIIDNKGNAVSITTTLNNSFGSKTVIGGAGFFMNDEMDDFSAKPGVPNLFGAVGGEANAIAPGKRMLSSMTPTIVLKNNKPFLVLGTPGGTTIITSVFQTILDIINFKLSTKDAVDKPKFHHQWLPDQIEIEKGFSEKTSKSLEKMGYKLVKVNSIGRTEVIRVLSNNTFESVADHRGEDDAEGY